MLKIHISLWGGLLLVFFGLYFENTLYQSVENNPGFVLFTLALWIVYGITLYVMLDAKYFKKENLKITYFSIIALSLLFVPILYISVAYFKGNGFYFVVFYWIILWGIMNSNFVKETKKNKMA